MRVDLASDEQAERSDKRDHHHPVVVNREAAQWRVKHERGRERGGECELRRDEAKHLAQEAALDGGVAGRNGSAVGKVVVVQRVVRGPGGGRLHGRHFWGECARPVRREQ